MATQNGLLEGKLALVTGAGSGVGEAVAYSFANEGATVVADDTTTSRSRESSGRSGLLANLHLRSLQEATAYAVRSARERFT